MSLDSTDPRLARVGKRLAPYVLELLERAGRHALRLHADNVTAEHVLSVLMEDEQCAAAAVILHAFADPQTISAEVLALSPGVMVVASDSTLPFSPLGVQALSRARALADQRAVADVESIDLIAAAWAALDERLRAALAAAGFASEHALVAAARAVPVDTAAGHSLFKHFSLSAKRCLSAANRIAAGSKHAAISPAHIVLGCLKSDEELATQLGLGFQRARTALGGQTADESAPTPRPLRADDSLLAFLDGVEPPGDSLSLLSRYLAGGTPELAQLLMRHKITPALLAHARGAFGDPPVPAR